MPAAVIAQVNELGKNEPSILTFTDWQGWEIGDHPQEVGVMKMMLGSKEWTLHLRMMLSPQEWTQF